MKKMRIFNTIITFIVIFCSICYSVETILNNDLYGSLLRLSIIPVILLPNIVEKIFKYELNLFNKFIYIIFVFFAYFLGSIVGLYENIYWYDTFTHFLSGIIVYFFGLEFLIRSGKYDKKSILFNVLFLISISFMLAGGWEIFEFSSDRIFNHDVQKVIDTGVTDTMKDMIMQMLGTCLCAISYCYELENKRNLLFKKFIGSF